MSERKFATVKREVASKVGEAEKKVEAAVEATKALSDTPDMAPDQMKSCCEKAGSTQSAAHSEISAARTLLLNRQKDAKVVTADSAILTELGKMMDRLSRAQTELEKQKGLLRDQEHRFVAKRLLKDATDMMDQLEKRLKETAEVAAPLASDKAEDFAGAMYLQHVADALKAHMKTTQKSSKVIFDEMSEQKDSVVVERFVSFVGELPGVKASEDDGLSEEQLKAAYDCLKGREEQLSERAFLDQLRTKFICASVVSITDELKLKEGKTVRKLELNEIVEALEEPVKDETVDLMRVKVKAEKDDKEGYITLAGNQGTRYLEPYSPFAACKKVVELRLKQLADKAREVGKYIEQKGEELKSVRTGPLAETKSELLQMRPRVSKVKAEHEELKKRVAQADKKQAECMEAERRRRKEAADRRAAAALTCEAEQMVSSCQETVEEAVSAAKALEDTRGSEEENPIAAIAKVERVLEAALQGVDAAGVKIKAGMDEIKAATEGPLKDARATLIKLKVRVGALESKCKAQQLGLQRARKQVASDAHEAVTRALQLFVRKAGKRPDEVFTELSQGGQEVPVDELRKFVGGIPDHGLKAAQLELGLERYAGGVTRLTLLELLQEFKRCVKDIAITTAFEVKDSKTLRKLAVGELIEVLEADRADKDGIARVRCRALSDQKEGWATLRGNQGTAYMVKAAKPYPWRLAPLPIPQKRGAHDDGPHRSGARGRVQQKRRRRTRGYT
ncbi:unnamed protein product [Prorocentrum cordatum]|uniref:Uncharacterized protein n=1 Tax=Prorocentrum cordatum TaxID=2364126 RepID=A0ABN9PVG4_9DINO|nr:unnamed protein product [Polarella glacialis]